MILYFDGVTPVYVCMYAILGHKFSPYCLKKQVAVSSNRGPEPPLRFYPMLSLTVFCILLTQIQGDPPFHSCLVLIPRQASDSENWFISPLKDEGRRLGKKVERSPKPAVEES